MDLNVNGNVREKRKEVEADHERISGFDRYVVLSLPNGFTDIESDGIGSNDTG